MSIEALAAVSIWTGIVAYLALSAFFVVGWLRRITGRAALASSLATFAWLFSLHELGARPIVGMLEETAYTAWIVLLARVLGVGPGTALDPHFRTQTTLTATGLGLFAISLVHYLVAPDAWGAAFLPETLPVPAYLKLASCLVGLVMIEQVFRNTRRDARWNLKFLSVGLTILLAYGFVLHADSSLFHMTRLSLFVAHGFVTAMAAPFLAIASLRSRDQRLNLNLSRRFVFGSGMLVAAGLYLLAMGTAGYYVRLFGGDWGDVVETLLVVVSLIGLAVIAMSRKIRASLRVLVARNLFQYKYDYREEWLRVTGEFAETHPDESLAQRAIHALADLLQSTSGRYYRLAEGGALVPAAEVSSVRTVPISRATAESLAAFFTARNWIVDLDELRAHPERYERLDLTADESVFARDRFIVPLMSAEAFFGIVVLGPPMIATTLIWEDYDIVKTVARQAAAFLALQHADAALAASAQLRAMDQMSAFVVHDLKTVSAQLSLLVGNAARHRSNPAFIDDMVKTTENAVARMDRLVAQLRDRPASQRGMRCRLADVARAAVERRSYAEPVPILSVASDGLEVDADSEQLVNVITHIIQNAQEATARDGDVSVVVGQDRGWATVAVRDSGAGMTPQFMETSLFTPFATTKGVAGVGIGAYQSREYLRSIGGDLTARSEVGRGSEFTLRVPLHRATVERR